MIRLLPSLFPISAPWVYSGKASASAQFDRKVNGVSLKRILLLLMIAMFQAAWAQGGGAGVFALRTSLQDKDPEIRMKAAEGLGRVGGREAVLILRQGLSDKSLQVRLAVMKALGFVGGRLAITVISEALKDKSPEVRIKALEALVEAGTVSSIPVIQKAFGDKEESVRLHATLMLRQIGHRLSVPALGQVLVTDSSPAVRAAAAEYLGKIGAKNPRALGFLAQGLEDKVPLVRIRVIESLGFLQLQRAIPLNGLSLLTGYPS